MVPLGACQAECSICVHGAAINQLRRQRQMDNLLRLAVAIVAEAVRVGLSRVHACMRRAVAV